MMDDFKEDGTPQDAAIGWLVRMQSDAFSAGDWAALTRWLDASPENLEAFEAMERLALVLRCASQRVAGPARYRARRPQLFLSR